MERYIIQIGRLDKGVVENKKINFTIDSKNYNTSLSSFALKQHFGNASVILLFPVSLPFNKSLVEGDVKFCSEELKNKIEKIINSERDWYFNDPLSFFKNVHPQGKEADDCLVIHSIGEYEGVEFEGYFDDIVLEIFVYLVENYLKNEKIKEIYIDISTGLNIYISALLEAIRHFYVFTRLLSWGEENQIKLCLVYTDPIIGSSAKTPRIYTDYILNYKVFFSSPIKVNDITGTDEKDTFQFSIAKEIAGDDRELKKEINKFLDHFTVCFSAIKNNIPLAIYTFEIDKIEDVKKLLQKILYLTKERLYKDIRKTPKLKKDIYLKFFLSMSFSIGILKIFNKYGINPGIHPKEEGVSINEIEQKFEEIYEEFGLHLNISFLKTEISNIKKKVIDEKGEWKDLKSYFSELESKDTQPVNRNFFAHSGFEKSITIIRKMGEELYIKYDEKHINMIKKWLREEI